MKKFLAILLSIFLAFFIISSCSLSKKKTGNDDDVPKDSVPVIEEVTKEVNLYFTSDNIISLTAEKRTVTSTEDNLYKKTVEELIKGPQTEGLFATVHADTKIDSVTLNEKTATIDFTSTFAEKNTGGSTREFLCLYSIVNTLCEFEEIDEVIFKDNGKTIQTFGQFDMTEPYKMNDSLIK